MPTYPSVCKNFNLYGPGGVEFGVADVTCPHLQFEKDPIKQAGIAGTANLPVQGNVQALELVVTFPTNTPQSLALFAGGGQRIRCLSSIMLVDSSSSALDEQPEQLIFTAWGNGYNQGKRESSSKATISISFDCVYFALIFGGKKFWEIDIFGNVCLINGVDLNAKTRANT